MHCSSMPAGPSRSYSEVCRGPFSDLVARQLEHALQRFGDWDGIQSYASSLLSCVCNVRRDGIWNSAREPLAFAAFAYLMPPCFDVTAAPRLALLREHCEARNTSFSFLVLI